MRRILIALGLCVAPSIALSETYVVPVVTARIGAETYSTTTGFQNDSNADVECIGRYVREDGRVLTAKYVVPAKTHRVEPDTLVEARAVGSMRLECSGALSIASRIQSSRDGGLIFAAGHVFPAASEKSAVTPRASRTVRGNGDLLALEPDGAQAAFTIVVKDGAGEIVAEQPYALSPHSQQHIGVGALSAELEQLRVEIKVRSGRVIVLEQSSAKALATLAPEVTLEQRVTAAKSGQPPRPQTATVAESLLLCPFKAAPFRDPATGLCFMRDRWYDPETGTFLTPDRSGYTDSSNLYAFGRNDPVNLSDPTGEAVPAVAYLGHVALQTGIDVGIDWAFHEAGDWWTGSHTTFDWHDSLQTNFAINLASAGVGGKLKHLQKLRNPVLRKLATEGADYGFDVGATGTVDMLLHGQSAGEAYGSAAVGGAVGRGASYSVARGWRRFQARSRYDYSADFDKDLVNFVGSADYVDEVLSDDLLVVQYHNGALALGKGRSAKWWEPAAQGNAQSTLDDVFEDVALVVPDWGPRNAVSVARIPRGTAVTYYIGQTAAQRSALTGRVFRGRGLQLRFRDFDPRWVVETRILPP